MLQSDHVPDVNSFVATSPTSEPKSSGDGATLEPAQELEIVVGMEAASTRTASVQIVKRSVASPKPILDLDFDEREAS